MEIIKQRDMSLLNRKRYSLWIDNTNGTPSRKELVDKVAKELKVKSENVFIKHIYAQFGNNRTKLIVHVYDNPEHMAKYEHPNLLKKHERDDKKPEAEKAEEPKVEKTEEKTEKKEQKAEEKPKEEPKAEKEDKEPEKAGKSKEKTEKEDKSKDKSSSEKKGSDEDSKKEKPKDGKTDKTSGKKSDEKAEKKEDE